MPTVPEDDSIVDPQPNVVERTVALVTAPVVGLGRTTILLAVAAGAASVAPTPFDVIAVVTIVAVASDIAHRR